MQFIFALTSLEIFYLLFIYSFEFFCSFLGYITEEYEDEEEVILRIFAEIDDINFEHENASLVEVKSS